MINTHNLDFLREQVNALKSLLDDPHPGLASWVSFYAQRMDAINRFWNDDTEPTSMAVLAPITTPLASTEDAEDDRLYDQWNKKERHD